MQLPLFYEPTTAPANETLLLGEETSRHCVQVLRMREGEQLQLTDGNGNLLTATIIGANKRHCTIRIDRAAHRERENRNVCIAISLLKNANRFEWFLEKAVEMGVQEIIPLLCERTEKQHYKADRFHNIVVSAMLQSRQLWLPLLHPPTPFGEAIAGSSHFAQKLVAHCLDDDQKTGLPAIAIANAVQMLIGPEGDFSEMEIAGALQHGYRPVSLGNTRLRTETAGVVASALLIHSPKRGDIS